MTGRLSLIAGIITTISCCVVLSTSRDSEPLNPTVVPVHRNPIVVHDDPYSVLALHAEPANTDEVCAIVFENEEQDAYHTVTFPSREAAQTANAYVTHVGPCGACSSLQDLAIYQFNRDLTTAGRRCGFLSWLWPLGLWCFKQIGFSDSCAEIWLHDARHTGKNCFWVCLKSFLSFEENNKPDGTLNDCIQCDEDKSGNVFKNVARRTRRNSGIISEIDRPPEQIAPVVHDYPLAAP